MIKESSNLIKRETKLATSSSQNNKEHRYAPFWGVQKDMSIG